MKKTVMSDGHSLGNVATARSTAAKQSAVNAANRRQATVTRLARLEPWRDKFPIFKTTALSLLIGGGVLLCPVAFGDTANMPRQPSEHTPVGLLKRPEHYRDWVYLSSGFAMSYNPAMQMNRHMFDNVFVDPAAYKLFVTTGTWPDKTVLVSEIRGAEGVVPVEEGSAVRACMLDRAGALGEVGSVFQGSELRFGARVVIGDVRTAVGFGALEVDQQRADGLGAHAGTPIGGQCQRSRTDLLLGELRGFSVRDQRHMQRRLPRYAFFYPTRNVLVASRGDTRPARKSNVSIVGQHLLSINWADAAPEMSWPAAYYAVWVPILTGRSCNPGACDAGRPPRHGHTEVRVVSRFNAKSTVASGAASGKPVRSSTQYQ